MHQPNRMTLMARASTALSRRAAFRPLAGGAVAALVRPGLTQAGKARKKIKKRCRRQIGQCEASITAFCDPSGSGVLGLCGETLLPCCQLFNGCKADEAVGCLYDGSVLLR